MTTQTKKRVFLSFDHDDAAQVNGLRGVIQNPNHELEAYDESVRAPIESEDAGYIKSVIGEKIKRSSVTVCLISATTHKSEWVDWELGESETRQRHHRNGVERRQPGNPSETDSGAKPRVSPVGPESPARPDSPGPLERRRRYDRRPGVRSA